MKSGSETHVGEATIVRLHVRSLEHAVDIQWYEPLNTLQTFANMDLSELYICLQLIEGTKPSELRMWGTKYY